MGYGKCGWVIVKGRETKDMGEECTVASHNFGQRYLCADCSENVPSVPGECRVKDALPL
jgi:hypothetical protein